MRDQGLDSPVSSHFGSAPLYAVVDVESGAVRCLPNARATHEHGACSPLESLRGETLAAMIVGGIGGGAIAALRSGGIRVLRGGAPTVRGCLARLAAGELEEVGAQDACAGHAHEPGAECRTALPSRR
jgi:predicted Fe-Mo cluster-binding NifX family protein